MVDRLFVYGSLLAESEHEMAIYLKRYVKLIGRGYIRGKLYQVAWYPGAIDIPNSSYRIWGTLLELSNSAEVFSVLDEYEGYNPKLPHESLFVRKKASVVVDNQKFETWFYAYNHPLEGFPFIEDGDYLAFKKKS